ncbi:MAG: site-specific DNA-methyltransferase [Polyangiaceae bacterium]
MRVRLELDAPPEEPALGFLEPSLGSDPPPLRLIDGDNAGVLGRLVDEGVQVHLAYLDPPFFTQRQHHRTKRKRDEAGQLARTEHLAFDDRWPDLGTYLAHLKLRLELIRELLTPDGSVVIHVDSATSHYIKVMADALFGVEAFASEIIWRYRRWPAKTKNFQRVHDVLLRYQRDASTPPRFCQLYEPLAASTVATWGDKKQLADVRNGRRVRSTKTKERSPGAPLGDVWEIGIIAPIAKERTGYPTQKPEALLRRLIAACSYPGDLVLDPYVGSGTTLVVAAEEGRRAIGIDQSREALDVARERLRARDHTFLEQRFVPEG